MDEKIDVIKVRSIVRGHLEDLVLGDKMSLDEAKQVAKKANKLLGKEVVLWQELTESARELNRLFPDLERLWKMLVFELGLESKRQLVDSRAMPLVDKGNLDEAIKVLDSFLVG